jgi:hypothetical protein
LNNYARRYLIAGRGPLLSAIDYRRQESCIFFFSQADHKKVSAALQTSSPHFFYSPRNSRSFETDFSICLSVDPFTMATLAEKLEKIKSPKLQNQHHVRFLKPAQLFSLLTTLCRLLWYCLPWRTPSGTRKQISQLLPILPPS